jgi:putative ABC transport system permease protein
MKRTMLLQNLRSAFVSLFEQRQRTMLSAVGVMVGALAIVLLMSIAKGVQADVTSQVKDIGVNVLIVIPGRIESGTFNPNLGGQSFLQPEDADRAETVPGVLRAVSWTFAGGGVRNGEKIANSILVATESGWFDMHKVTLQEGRVFRPEEDLADVAVIGSVAKEELFGDGPAVGKHVTINKRKYRVVGVTKDKRAEQSLFSMGSLQNLVYIPYQRLRQVERDVQTDRIMVQIAPDSEPRALIRNLDRVFEERLDRQQFQVLTQEDLLGLVYKLMGILTWLVTGLTSIALFVAGVGIMTVMVMSVNERAKEIGIRKTVGARRGDIFTQFLFESCLVGLVGGILGLGLSTVVSVALTQFTPIKPMITPSIVLVCFSVSVGVGAIFGLLPAMRAASKDPVASLRNE